jgi:hypothetical protein
MKTINILFLLFLVSANLFSQAWDGSATAWTEGDGLSAETAYEISTPAHLAYLAQQVNAGTTYENQYFKMTTNLDLDGLNSRQWIRIGSSATSPFKGVFDGGGNSILNINIYRNEGVAATDGIQGLFGYVDGGTIQNLGINSGFINGLTNVGVIVGILNNGTVQNCYNHATVETTRAQGVHGGIVGKMNSGTIRYCYNAGDVMKTRGAQNNNIGGIVGQSDAGTIEFCYNIGSVSGNNGVGGIVGSGVTAIIHNCYNTGTIKGKLNSGGIVGITANFVSPAIEKCYSTGFMDISEVTTGNYGAILGANNDRTVNKSFYDVPNIVVTPKIVKGAATSTADMLGDALKSALGDTDWEFVAGKYPQLKNRSSVHPATTLSGAVTSAVLKNTAYNYSIAASGVLTMSSPKSVNKLTIESGAKLDMSTHVLTVTSDLILKVSKTSVPELSLTQAIALADRVLVQKTMEPGKWYFMSFPGDVVIDDITHIAGTGSLSPATLGSNWWIKYYDGASRIENLGAVSNWKSMTTGQTLQANKGYIIGLGTSLTGDHELSFPINKSLVTTAEAERTVAVVNHGEGVLTPEQENHIGWNLVGVPYLSKFAGSGVGTNYLTFWNGTTYVQPAKEDVASINPYEAFFVQASASGTTNNLAFSLASRQLVNRQAAAISDEFIRLALSNEHHSDVTTLLLNDEYSVGYEINRDLEKWNTTGTQVPQLYSSIGNVKYAFNALPEESLSRLFLGYYLRDAGMTSLRVSDMNLTVASNLWLTDHTTGSVVDLTVQDYTFHSESGWHNERFSLGIQSVSTQVNVLENNFSYWVDANNVVLKNIPGKGTVQVFNATGKLVASTNSSGDYLQLKLNGRGVYLVKINTDLANQSFKIKF